MQRWPAARLLNIALGVWLFFSAFIWQHTVAQMTNTWIIGVLSVMFALIAIGVPAVRYLNTALAIWLFISALALPRLTDTTAWNNCLVAIGLFVVSLAPGRGEAALITTRRPQRV